MDTWSQIQERLKNELTTPSYQMWFATASQKAVDDGVVTVEVHNSFAKDWIESRYKHLVNDYATQIRGKKTRVKYVLAPETGEDSPTPIEESELDDHASKNGHRLNPKYTFDHFVIGDSNKFAHAACLAAAKHPGKAYNPLFIYGGVGLGKTHLLQAIGHEILARYPTSEFIYTTTESFVTDVVEAIKNNRVQDFHNFYRSVKVLLIDDIQFLSGKERTQEELFHTFNVLYDVGSQIVFTSDKPPKQLKGIADRLKSRFEMGLQADIQAPDLETRIAILEKKASQEQVNVPQEVINYVASHGFTNIRELEGSLIRLVAVASLSGSNLNLSSAKTALRDMIPKTTKTITVEDIISTVASEFQVSPDDIIQRKRTVDIAMARQVSMYLAREMTDLSLKAIGEKFGGRDHTTVMYACDKIVGMREDSETVDNRITDIISRLDA